MRETPSSDATRPSPSPQRPAASVVAGAVLGIALLVSIVGSFITYTNVRVAFTQHIAYDEAVNRLNDLNQLQTDEESALRGFMSTGQRFFLQPFASDEPQFTPLFRDLAQFCDQANVLGATQPLYDLRREHFLWDSEVAQPLMQAPNAPDSVERLERGKIIMDQTRSDYRQVRMILEARSQHSLDESFSLLRRASIVTAALILLFGISALVADAYRGRTQQALAREKVVTDTLQRAFLSGWDAVAPLRIGTAYLSSTREAAIGGDLFDVYRLDDHRTMLLVADISGKGLDAAMETALVKYSIRTLADTDDDPAAVLQRFNRIFERSTSDAGAFVSLFVGIFDDRDLSLRFASAGHGPVYLRTGQNVTPLLPTGPVVGADEATDFSGARLQLHVGDIVVLATDGLTEARDQAGVMLGDDQAMRWIARGSQEPQRLADDIVRQLQQYAGGRIADDLALLIIRVQRAPVGTA